MIIYGCSDEGRFSHNRLTRVNSGTHLWDVRTKDNNLGSIPIPFCISGLATYSPGAILFILCADNSVRRFNLNTASIRAITRVQLPAALFTPTVSVPKQTQHRQGSTSNVLSSISEVILIPSYEEDSENVMRHEPPTSPAPRQACSSGKKVEQPINPVSRYGCVSFTPQYSLQFPMSRWLLIITKT